MSTPRAFVTRTLLPEALDIIREVADVTVWPEETPPPVEELRRHAGDSDGILTTIMDRVDADLLDAAPRLRAISQLAVGLDNVDVAEATRRGIPVGYTPGVLAKSTADLAMALLLGAARRTSESERWLRGGGWQIQFHPTHWLGQDVHEACLGIVGLGQIGREIAKRARGFDMDIVYHSRTRYPDVEAELRPALRGVLRPAGTGGFCCAQRAADARNPSSHQRAATGHDETVGHPHQRVARAGGGSGRPCMTRCATGRSPAPPWT